MFLDNLKLKKYATLRSPPLPASCLNWRPPSEFPNLDNATAISFDCETKERDWDSGPGWSRGMASICGFSVGAVDRSGAAASWYFPVGHEIEPEYNLDPQRCFGWLADILGNNKPKVFANAIFDIGNLSDLEIDVNGPLNDVQFAEALIDEEATVALDDLGLRYLNQGKNSTAMEDWLKQAYPGLNPKTNIYRASPRLVGPYGEGDALLPLQILPLQQKQLDAQNLNYVYDMERESIPLYIAMRRAGVSVDIKKAEQVDKELTTTIKDQYDKLAWDYGLRIESTAATNLEKLFKHIGLDFPTKGKYNHGSFEKEWLKALEHPIGEQINAIRINEKCQGTFIRKYILQKTINGKIHCQYHPLRGEDGGTKTGRLSSSDPNLQNIPVRTKIGKEIRKIFIPDKGHKQIRKYDYSQIEYRMLAHYAVGTGADKLRETYIRDPKTDYHNNVMIDNAAARSINLEAMTKEERDDFRRPIKNVNFGLMYGQSRRRLMYTAGMTQDQANIFFPAYFQSAPYIKPTMEMNSDEVQKYGFITTIFGRRTRFNLWESADRGTKTRALPYREALMAYGTNIKRAYDYRGTNYRFQGGAAEIIKASILAAHKSGVLKETGIPRLQVHDEFDFSEMHETRPEAWDYLKYTLENTVKIRVPVITDCKVGLTWGDIN